MPADAQPGDEREQFHAEILQRRDSGTAPSPAGIDAAKSVAAPAGRLSGSFASAAQSRLDPSAPQSSLPTATSNAVITFAPELDAEINDLCCLCVVQCVLRFYR